MKVTKVSEHIWSLKTWMVIPVHVWIVVDEEGVTLIDAGFPMMAKGILKFLDNLNAGPLKRILLTHGHADHVGAVEGILAVKNVPVYAHAIEIPYLVGEEVYPKRKKLEYNLPKHIVQPLQLDETNSLKAVEGLMPYHTPGHSPGHVVYFHEEDEVLLAGDLFTSRKGKIRRPMPMFTGDMKEAVKSSLIVEQLKPKRLEVCHGNSVYNPAEQIVEYVQKMREN